jgi:hypothetical protein
MTTPRLHYLIGAPGAGKSTLMAKLTDPFDRLLVPSPDAPVAHDQLRLRGTSEVVGAELGVQRGLFSGTDALPSSIIEKAIPWVQTRPYDLLLGEGARLANKRFLLAARDAGYELIVALLDHKDRPAWHAARQEQIGREQNPSWVQGRVTASHNLAEQLGQQANGPAGLIVLAGHPDQLYRSLAALLLS